MSQDKVKQRGDINKIRRVGSGKDRLRSMKLFYFQSQMNTEFEVLISFSRYLLILIRYISLIHW